MTWLETLHTDTNVVPLHRQAGVPPLSRNVLELTERPAEVLQLEDEPTVISLTVALTIAFLSGMLASLVVLMALAAVAGVEL